MNSKKKKKKERKKERKKGKNRHYLVVTHLIQNNSFVGFKGSSPNFASEANLSELIGFQFP